MDSKPTVKFTNSKYPPEIQSEVDKLQKAFARAQEHLEKIEETGIAMKHIKISTDSRKTGNNLYTQKGHDVKIHHEIFKWYTQSIAFAPEGTEELALGYSNRSIFLMHLRYYEESLVDIERAFQHSKDDVFKMKLQARKEKCVGLLSEQKLTKSTKNLSLSHNKELEKIRALAFKNFKPSASIPSAADCIAAACNETHGRHLIATRDIKPGEIVIVEQGCVGSPDFPAIYNVCSHCFQYAWNGIPCNKCVYAVYCSEDCKNEAFNEYHDIECPMLKYMHQMVFSNEVICERIATIRLLIMALRKEGLESVMKEISEERDEGSLDCMLSDGILKSDSFKACYNLSPFVKAVGQYYEDLEFNTYQTLYILLERTNFHTLIRKTSSSKKKSKKSQQSGVHDHNSAAVDPLMLLKFKEALMKLKSITATNHYPIQSGTTQCGNCSGLEEHLQKCQFRRGAVIVPCSSLVNHSCTANVTYLSTPKRKIIYFSTCPIKKGDMICSSYRSTVLTHGNVKARELKLKNFICRCKACLENIDVLPILKNDSERDSRKMSTELTKKFSMSAVRSYLYESVEDHEVSQKEFQDMRKFSQILYSIFNYYKAFVYSSKSSGYFEKTIYRLYKDKLSMPHNCSN